MSRASISIALPIARSLPAFTLYACDCRCTASFLDGWEILLGLNPRISNLTSAGERLNYGYTSADWLNAVSGVKIGGVTTDAEGNIPEKMTADLLQEAGFLIAGSPQQVIDGIMKVKEGCEYDDFMFGSWFEQPGLGWEGTRDQMHLFAEEVMPVLQKECGGSPEFPDLGLGYTTSDGPISK